MDKTGGPAFPSRGGMMFYVPETARGEIEQAVAALDQHHAGLSLRDYFAAKALPSVLAQDESGIQAWAPDARFSNAAESAAEYWARTAYAIADAMIAERSK